MNLMYTEKVLAAQLQCCRRISVQAAGTCYQHCVNWLSFLDRHCFMQDSRQPTYLFLFIRISTSRDEFVCTANLWVQESREVNQNYYEAHKGAVTYVRIQSSSPKFFTEFRLNLVLKSKVKILSRI